MLTVVLVVSLANLLLNVIAVLQRHKAIQLAQNPHSPGPNDPGTAGSIPLSTEAPPSSGPGQSDKTRKGVG